MTPSRIGLLARASIPHLPNHLTPPRRVLAILALIGANAIWGGSPAASMGALGHMEPFTVGAARAGIAVLLFALLLGHRRVPFATGRIPAVLGLFGVTLFCALQNIGLLVSDATTTALVGGTKPVLIAALAVPLLGERLRGSQLGGLAISIVGVAVIVLLGAGTAPQAAVGGLVPLASAGSFAIYAVMSRRAFDTGPALPVIAGATRYGFLFLLPPAVIELAVRGTPTVSTQDTLLLLYLGGGCSALAFVLCGYGFTHLAAGEAAPYSNFRLVAGVALAVLLLGEHVTATGLTGGVLVLLGAAVGTRAHRERRPHAPARNTSAGIPVAGRRDESIIPAGVTS
jgi:drug/metabolite transporter (DMT)-like permease